MKNSFTKNPIVLICCLALTVGVTNYIWQKASTTSIEKATNNQEVLTPKAVQETPNPVITPETTSKTDVTTLSKPSKTKKVTPSVKQSKTSQINDYDTHLASVENNKAKEKKSVGGRWKAEFNMIKDPKTGQIPRGIQLKEINAAKKTREFQLPAELGEDGVTLRTLPTIGITSRGPNNYGGRTRAIGFDKRNTQIMLAGSVSSGIFRSTDGGGSWTRVTPAGEIHSVTAFAQDPRAGQEDVWYCGTGENLGNSANGTGASYLGHGILKSTNNGVTWTPLANTRNNLYSFDLDFDYISRIVVDPTNGAVLVAASESIKRSLDGGTTWEDVLGTGTNGQPSDIIYNAVSGTFYASIYGTNASGGVWRSTTGETGTWTKIRTPTELDAGGTKRIVLSNVANTANILAFYETTANVACGASKVGLQLYDPTGMGTWADHTAKIGVCAGGTTTPKAISSQGGYNMCITTKPNDADIVYLGGVEIYRLNLTTAAYEYIGGSQLPANATNLHVDNHLLLFEPGSNDILWAGNDGGVRKTDATGAIAPGATGGYTWTDRTSNYVTYQYYGADIHPTMGSDFVAGGAQDNAFTIQPTTAEAKEVGPTVDGIHIGLISGTDFNNYSAIICWQEGAIARLTNGATTDIKPDMATQEFKTYFLLDGDNTSHLYYPTNTKKLYRTRNATAIADGTISADASTNWEEITGVAATLTGNISFMAVTRNVGAGNTAYTASNASRKMYMGTDDGKVYRLADPAFGAIATAPVDITPAGATGFVSGIATNPYDDKEVLVTYSNYGTPSVWHTADASVATPTWTNVEGATGTAVELASARSAMIVRAGSTPVYVVGTSTGLYGTTALSGATTVWEKISPTDIAQSPSVAMRLRTSDNKMVLGTHGNGLFMLEFPAAVLPLDLLSFNAAKNKEAVQLKWASANEVGFSHYNVQKSDDGKYFSLLTTVKATGSGTYQTVDDKPFAGQNYYRLEMVDVDGKRRFSKVVNVTFDTKVNLVSVYPNPAKTSTVTLDLTMNKESDLIFEWTDIAGRSRLRNTQKVAQGNSQISVDVSALESGIYFITTRNVANNETLRVMRFIKQ
jgi:Secretion system C-terminal sorting domain